MADDDGTASTDDNTDKQDTSSNPAQPDTGTDDSTQQDQPSSSTDKDKEDTDWKAETEKWKALARKHESRVKELTPKAAKLQELEDKNKSELQKKEEQLAAQATELQELRIEKIRRSAASAAGLDPDLAEFITATEEDAAVEQAKKLAERVKTQKSPDFKQGARQSPAPSRSRDELLRGIAGYGTN